MTTHDPIDDVRAELARVPAPTTPDLDVQRGRLDAEMHAATPARRSRRAWLRRRWLPASGLAVVGFAAAILVAIALQPGPGSDDVTSAPRGMQVVTSVPGGAFAGLDLESATAAEVLRAAGAAAAKGVPEAGSGGWTYVRTESGGPDSETSFMERWTSPDGERSHSVSTVEITDPRVGDVGRHYSLHYEHLEREVLGDVSWRQVRGDRERRATWSTDANDGSGEIARLVELTRELRDTKDADDVRDALYASVEGAKLEFRDGMACGTVPKYSFCSSSGFVPQAKGLDPEASKRLFLTGQLLTIMVQAVYPPDATRAIYDYLATLPEATAAPAADGSGDVILSLRVKGPSYTTHRMPNQGRGRSYETRPIPGSTFNTKAVAALDPDTGRIVELGPKPGLTDMSIRYTAFGIAPGPGIGSEICEAFSEPCDEARDFEQRRETDPDATFTGVVDWMFISQFCDGMINRDGTPKQGDHMPRSMSKDPKVKAEREACEQREAEAAQGD